MSVTSTTFPGARRPDRRRRVDAHGVGIAVSEWGDIDDISTPNQLRAAVARLRSTLASQRVVWISSDPLTALRVDGDPRCGITPLAHLGGH